MDTSLSDVSGMCGTINSFWCRMHRFNSQYYYWQKVHKLAYRNFNYVEYRDYGRSIKKSIKQAWIVYNIHSKTLKIVISLPCISFMVWYMAQNASLFPYTFYRSTTVPILVKISDFYIGVPQIYCNRYISKVWVSPHLHYHACLNAIYTVNSWSILL